MIYLIAGSTGAGKSTYSRKLAREGRVVVFSIDDWMKTLYWPEMPKNHGAKWFSKNHTWYTERIARCENQIWQLTTFLAQNGQDVCLDLGFATQKHRHQFIELCKEAKLPCEIHYLKLDAESRWERVQERQREKGSTYAMDVDIELFEFVESIFEEPSCDKGCRVVEVSQ